MRLDEGIEHGLNFVSHPTNIQSTVPIEVRRSLCDEGVNLHVFGERSRLGTGHERVEQADEALRQNQELGAKLLVLELPNANIDICLQIGSKRYADIGKMIDHRV